MLSDESNEARLARIETRFDSLEKKIDVFFQRLMDDQEQRIRKLEKWRNALPVTLVLAVVSIVASVAAVYIRLG